VGTDFALLIHEELGLFELELEWGVVVGGFQGRGLALERIIEPVIGGLHVTGVDSLGFFHRYAICIIDLYAIALHTIFTIPLYINRAMPITLPLTFPMINTYSLPIPIINNILKLLINQFIPKHFVIEQVMREVVLDVL
jgi:hypothetical protein